MPALLLYLLHVNGALLLFCLGYYLVLRRLTFYGLNRGYLLFAVAFAVLYPVLDWAALLPRPQPLPLELPAVVPNWPLLVAAPAAAPYPWHWLGVLYGVGAAGMLARLLGQLLAWYRLHRAARPATVAGYRVRRLAVAANPFSFWQTIYVQPEQHPPAELHLILRHEQVHVRQWHTLDVLAGQLVLVACWFNPGAWLLLRAIQENLEFLTDRAVVRAGSDSRHYQYSLLHLSTNAPGMPVVNNFHFTTLKTRIIMLNKKKSASAYLLTYAVLVPGLVLIAIGCSKMPVEPAMAPADTTFALAAKAEDAQAQTKLPDNMLYFLDGQEIDKSVLATMDAEKIYHLNVLKGADFQQKFHTESAGGIVITSKQNKDSEAVRAFNAKYGITYKVVPAADLALTAAASQGKTLSESDLQGRLLLVDGQEMALADYKPAAGQNVSAYLMDPEKATAKYGAKGSKGALLIMTRPIIAPTAAPDAAAATKLHLPTGSLILVDGRETTQQELEKLDHKSFKVIHMFEGKPAVQRYGAKGKNGVLAITTRQ